MGMVLPRPLMSNNAALTAWRLGYGANVRADGTTEFRVWAPNLTDLSIRILAEQSGDREKSEQPRTIPMTRLDGSEFTAVVSDVGPGTDYFYLVEGERERPDPVSRWQARGVHGPSRVVDPASFSWSDQGWSGIPLQDFIIYEFHPGTFTHEGTFESAIPRLPYLHDLGITALEIMPVAEFPGNRNWGYDGASLYAPQSSYGGPEGLKKLVDACHQQGLAVVLDVVYNHLGPEGNYLPEFAPCFTDAYRSPWGKAINFDGKESDGIRRFFIDNALYWLTEYHVDALRLDAIHGIYDFGARHVLDQLAEAFENQARQLKRQAWLIAESDLDDVRIINPRAQGGYALDAQWHDDFHHALYTLLTPQREGFLMDFGAIADLTKSIRDGFVFDWKYSRYRGRHHGSSSKDRPGEQFVGFVQNHDQIANTSRGKRLASLVSAGQQKLAAVLTLCCPFVPMLFMGEEYGETNPFFYFTSFEDHDLATAVSEGRKRELGSHYSESDFADPQALSTFERCRLDWAKTAIHPHAGILRLYRELMALRKQNPSLGNCRKDLAEIQFDEQKKWFVMKRSDPSGSRALLVFNFAAEAQPIPIADTSITWRRVLWTGDEAYGGSPELRPLETLTTGSPLDLSFAGFEAVIYLS
jgi:maltooligosyltrehalose trehalohydrolase